MTGWKRSDRTLWRAVLDDVVLLAPEGDADPIALAGGRRLWEMLAEEHRAAQLTELLGDSASEHELRDLLESLAGAGLVERTGT